MDSSRDSASCLCARYLQHDAHTYTQFSTQVQTISQKGVARLTVTRGCMGTLPADHHIPCDVLALPHLRRLVPRCSPSPVVEALEDVDVVEERRPVTSGHAVNAVVAREWEGVCFRERVCVNYRITGL